MKQTFFSSFLSYAPKLEKKSSESKDFFFGVFNFFARPNEFNAGLPVLEGALTGCVIPLVPRDIPVGNEGVDGVGAEIVLENEFPEGGAETGRDAADV